MSTELADAIRALPLVDHHVHSCLAGPLTLDQFGQMLTESDRPAAIGTSPFDTQVGFAVRRHCAPALGLAEHVDIETYWDARQAIPRQELDRLLLGAAGVERWLIDTGFGGHVLLNLNEFGGRVAGARIDEIVRLETVMESIALDGDAATLQSRFADALDRATRSAVGLKSVIAYRHGFDFDPARPEPAEVRRAADALLRTANPGETPRLTDPVLLRMLLWEAVDTGLPVQLHVGYGDPDLDLRRCDPLRLVDWIKNVEPAGTEIMLLHCYPFHRNAGFLAQAFPHVYLDVGLAINYTGAASTAVLAEALELAPFGKVLYSSDAWGPPELHLLGAVLWRRGLTAVLSRWVDAGEWAMSDAIRVATLIGRDNAQRVYGEHHG